MIDIIFSLIFLSVSFHPNNILTIWNLSDVSNVNNSNNNFIIPKNHLSSCSKI
jgi:hypothetical protein